MLRTRERPVLQEQSIVQVARLMGESQESRAVIHGDEISEFELHLDDGVSHDNILIGSHHVRVHEGNFELFVLLVVLYDDLLKVVVHEVYVRVIVGIDLFLG